jgi:hypothetical protein
LLYQADGSNQQTFNLLEGLAQIDEEAYGEFPYERIATNLI